MVHVVGDSVDGAVWPSRDLEVCSSGICRDVVWVSVGWRWGEEWIGCIYRREVLEV